MADALTHTAVNLLGSRRSDHELKAGVVLGALLPDLLAKPAQLFLGAGYWTVAPTHSLFGILLISYLTLFFFTEDNREVLFWGLLLGQSLHLVLDYTQRSYVMGYDLLHPLPLDIGQMNLIWGEDWIFAAPVFGLICLVVYRKRIGLFFRGSGRKD